MRNVYSRVYWKVVKEASPIGKFPASMIQEADMAIHERIDAILMPIKLHIWQLLQTEIKARLSRKRGIM